MAETRKVKWDHGESQDLSDIKKKREKGGLLIGQRVGRINTEVKGGVENNTKDV